jgi:hypothetical protein
MAGSSADTPATPEFLRVSDAERDQAVNELRNEFALGRLSHETFMVRMQTALGARNRNELARLFTDLPPRRTRLAGRIRAAWRALSRQVRGSDAAADGRSPVAAAPPGHQAPWNQPVLPRPAPPAPLYFPPGSGTRFTIGRTHDCDLRLADLSVSRLHAELTRGENGWLLSDLGSHNGTRLNGWLIREPVPVRAGDRVEFGSAAFIIQGPAIDGPAIES